MNGPQRPGPNPPANPRTGHPTLRIRGLEVYYGKVYAVHGVDLDVWPGEVVALLGANGAGKSSILRAIMGLVADVRGTLALQGQSVRGASSETMARLGLAYVPEGRRVFGDLTVLDNLLMGAYAVADRGAIARGLEEIYQLFPVLRDRRRQVAATLSGGEQQMLATGRALMRAPQLLLLDEPSLGLAPVLVKVMYETIRRISERGTTILLAEQSARLALQIAQRAYVLETGRMVFQGDAASLMDNPAMREAYLGVA
jgi:branched-chain amino acid transport system ATP-binding protein